MVWFGFMVLAAGAGVTSFFARQTHIHGTDIRTIAGVEIDPISPDSRRKLEAAAKRWQDNVLVVQAFRPDGSVLQTRVRYREVGASWDVEKTLQHVQTMARRYPCGGVLSLPLLENGYRKMLPQRFTSRTGLSSSG